MAMGAGWFASLLWVAWGAALDGQFYGWDDWHNVDIAEGIAHLLRAGNGAELFEAVSSGTKYRPLSLLLWGLQWEIWGLNAAPFAAVDLAAHLVAACALYRVATRLGSSPTLGFCAAQLFVVLPVMDKSVAWISAREHVLTTMFFLLALASVLGWRRGKSHAWLGVGGALWACGLFCKETAVSFPIVALLLCIVTPAAPRRPMKTLVPLLAAVLLVYSLINPPLVRAPGSAVVAMSTLRFAFYDLPLCLLARPGLDRDPTIFLLLALAGVAAWMASRRGEEYRAAGVVFAATVIGMFVAGLPAGYAWVMLGPEPTPPFRFCHLTAAILLPGLAVAVTPWVRGRGARAAWLCVATLGCAYLALLDAESSARRARGRGHPGEEPERAVLGALPAIPEENTVFVVDRHPSSRVPSFLFSRYLQRRYPLDYRYVLHGSLDAALPCAEMAADPLAIGSRCLPRIVEDGFGADALREALPFTVLQIAHDHDLRISSITDAVMKGWHLEGERPIDRPPRALLGADTGVSWMASRGDLVRTDRGGLRHTSDRLAPESRQQSAVTPALMLVGLGPMRGADFDVLNLVMSARMEPEEAAPLSPDRFGSLATRNALPKLRVYWQSPADPSFRWRRSVATPLFADGEPHRYVFGLAGVPEWTLATEISAIGVELVRRPERWDAGRSLERIEIEISMFELNRYRSQEMPNTPEARFHDQK